MDDWGWVLLMRDVCGYLRQVAKKKNNFCLKKTEKSLIQNVIMIMHLKLFFAFFRWMYYIGHNFGSPSNIQIDHVTSHNFTVTWGEPIVRHGASICINGYHIEVFSDQENSTIFNHSYTQEDYSHNQESLHPNYRYEIQVSAIVAEMQGPIATHSVKANEDSKSCND